MRLCITGHRPNKMPSMYGYNIHNVAWMNLRRAFRDVSLFLYRHDHNLTVYTGMALGVDQALAEETFYMRSLLPGIQCFAAIPCHNHEVKWPLQSRELYHRILAQCDHSVFVTPGRYTAECMQKRNEYMVDNSDIVIAIWDGSKGGTGNCVSYAQKQGKKIIQIFPDTLNIRTDYKLEAL